MNIFSNIWNHPRTSVSGLLIGVVTVIGVLSQQGITLGNAGRGTVVSLIGALAASLLGLFARDPGDQKSSSGSTEKLGAWALISLLLVGMTPVGCTQQQKITVAQEIVNWTPSIVSAVDTVATTVAILDPQYALIIAPANTGFDVLASGLRSAANDYLANPNQTTLAFLQAEVVKFQQSVNTTLLEVAQIKDARSQQMAKAAVSSLATIINTVLGLVQSISTKAQVTAMAAQVHVTLARVRPYMDEHQMQGASERVSRDLALSHVPSAGEFFSTEARLGF